VGREESETLDLILARTLKNLREKRKSRYLNNKTIPTSDATTHITPPSHTSPPFLFGWCV
jgi:hypothetical protein